MGAHEIFKILNLMFVLMLILMSASFDGLTRFEKLRVCCNTPSFKTRGELLGAEKLQF